jgi:hypothetical protein
MPTKRKPIRRDNAQAEALAWSETFSSGYDFFDDLADFGIDDAKMSRADFLVLAQKAWDRFGNQFSPENAKWAFTELNNGD